MNVTLKSKAGKMNERGGWKSPGLSDGRMDRRMDARREGAVIISD